jgi:dCMP deaminase
MTDPRVTKIEYYFKIAKDVALRSPCISRRRFGTVIVKDDAIIGTGYAGMPRGVKNCGVDCECLKDLYNEERQKSYIHCRSIHSEQNAIINSGGRKTCLGATLYLSEINDDNSQPCYLCMGFIIQAGIKDVYYYKQIEADTDSKYIQVIHENVEDWIKLENDWIDGELKNAPKTISETLNIIDERNKYIRE